jgi:hypothetical protein
VKSINRDSTRGFDQIIMQSYHIIFCHELSEAKLHAISTGGRRASTS